MHAQYPGGPRASSNVNVSSASLVALSDGILHAEIAPVAVQHFGTQLYSKRDVVHSWHCN